MAHRLTNHFEPVEGAHGGEHMRRIGPLPPTRCQEFLLPTPTEHGVEQERFCTALDQAGAELRQDRGIEAGIGHFEAQDVFPIDPAAHGVRSRAISKPLGELEDRDEGEPSRREGGLAMRGEERGKRLVGEEGAEFIRETEIGMAFREGGVGDAGGLIGNGTNGLWAEHGDPPC